MKTFNIFTDGGSRGNPGPAAIGVVIFDESGKEIFRKSKQIGITTNNIAEYTAVLEALNWIQNNWCNDENIYHFNLDSSLAVNQLIGRFKIKNQGLKKIIIQIKNVEKEIKGKIFYQYISREKNKNADYLVNSAFDSK